MSAVPPSTDQIHDLWPTFFGTLALPDPQGPNAEFLRLAGEPGLPANLFDLQNDAVRWLESHAQSGVEQWITQLRASGNVQCRITARMERLGFCDYRMLGNDPGAHLSGTYFVNVPSRESLEHTREDCEPSCLSFFDPRVGLNAIALEGDPYYSQSTSVEPVAGVLMLWPGYVRHFARVHLSHEPWVMVRIRVEVTS